LFHVKQHGRAGTPPADWGGDFATIRAIAGLGEAVGYLSYDAALPAARRREGSVRARSSRSPRTDGRLMSLLLAAIGATIAALVEVTLAPYIAIGGAGPHPVLIGGVIWTIAAGIDRGITWAFVGGLVLDSLLGRPLGASALALLLATGGAAIVARPVPRLRLVAPLVAVPVLSLVYSLLILGVAAAMQPDVSVPDPTRLFLPGAIYDGILGMFLGPLAVTLHDRRAVTERVDW
jgi:rod shape-determining protein MreD